MERDNLEDAKNHAMQYRVKEIKHLENFIVICTRNELKCLENCEKAEAQLQQIQDRLDHEDTKLNKHEAALAEVQVRQFVH